MFDNVQFEDRPPDRVVHIGLAGVRPSNALPCCCKAARSAPPGLDCQDFNRCNQRCPGVGRQITVLAKLSQSMTVGEYSNGTKVRDTIPVSLGSEFSTGATKTPGSRRLSDEVPCPARFRDGLVWLRTRLNPRPEPRDSTRRTESGGLRCAPWLDKVSGTRRDGRTELQVLLDFLRPGDALVVTRIDRLARSLRDLQDIVHELKERRVTLRATEQPIDTGTAAGKAFLDMLGVFAEFETNLRKERQAEGIAAEKARGVYKGRKAKINAAIVRKLRYEEKLGPAEIARQLGIGRASVYRVLGKKAA